MSVDERPSLVRERARPMAYKNGGRFWDAIRAYEKSLIVGAIRGTRNLTAAATFLGMNNRTFWAKMHLLGIDPEALPPDVSPEACPQAHPPVETPSLPVKADYYLITPGGGQALLIEQDDRHVVVLFHPPTGDRFSLPRQRVEAMLMNGWTLTIDTELLAIAI